jgi:hypothetical protein
LTEQRLEGVLIEVEEADANGLKFAEDTRDFALFAEGAPLLAQPSAEPIGEETQSDVIAHAVGSVVKDRPNLQVTLDDGDQIN